MDCASAWALEFLLGVGALASGSVSVPDYFDADLLAALRERASTSNHLHINRVSVCASRWLSPRRATRLVLLLAFVLFLKTERKSEFLAGVVLVILFAKPHVSALFWPILAIWIIQRKKWLVASGFI